jgi:succinate-semialdehyde dehydrogenase/glutarate-semialdehyde dehydrogenase
MMGSFNPATGEVLSQMEEHSDSEVSMRLDRAVAAFHRHRRLSVGNRANLIKRAAEILETDKDRLGKLITSEMGKTLASAVQEVEKCAAGCRFYAENAARLLATESIDVPGVRAQVRYQPLGPVLAIMPWNFPFWQVFRFAAPNLTAGNVGLLKHASNVPQCALAIEEIFARAGFEPGAFQTLLVGSNRVAPLIADRRVAAVTLTGSVEAGRKVAAEAGKHLKKSVLELGGSDPFIVMPSANVEEAVSAAVRGRIINNGQSCIAAKRFIVHKGISEAFTNRFVQKMSALKVGDPMDPSTDVGPLATEDVLNGVERQVKESVRLGAKILTGGQRIPRRGFFFQPTVLTEIPRQAPATNEELFGPVASVFVVTNITEAIRTANSTAFGLGAAVWTKDPAERDQFLDEIESGLAFVNGIVASDPRVPFGGVKDSGYGRELGTYGLREFMNIKTTWQAHSES